MADLECVQSRSQIVSMKLRSIVKVPTTPTSSSIQRSASRPSPSPDHHHSSSHKFILSGGPGFSLALLDSSVGSVDRLPVPLPTKFGPATDVVAMTSAEILCVTLVGETQLWAGTESGGLHVYELSSELRLTNALYSNVEGSVLCMCGHVGRPTTDVAIGTFNGNVLFLSGPSDERGGLKDPFKNPRVVVQIGNSDSQSEVASGVNSVVLVHCSDKDTYWCACGGNIVVIAQSSWKELWRIDCRPPVAFCCPPNAEVAQLLSTDSGVWSCLSKCSIISLWNTKTFTAYFHFACDSDISGIAYPVVEITALSFSFPLLYVGTNAGHLIVFSVSEVPPKAGQSTSSMQYKFLAGIHCGLYPIIGLDPSPLQDSPSQRPPSASSTPAIAQQILVVCGNQQDSATFASASRVLHYELAMSSSRSSPSGVSPSTGQQQNDGRLSKSKYGRKLSIHSVSDKPLSYLPLPLNSMSLNCGCN